MKIEKIVANSGPRKKPRFLGYDNELGIIGSFAIPKELKTEKEIIEYVRTHKEEGISFLGNCIYITIDETDTEEQARDLLKNLLSEEEIIQKIRDKEFSVKLSSIQNTRDYRIANIVTNLFSEHEIELNEDEVWQ